jgi:hypothetical protein
VIQPLVTPRALNGQDVERLLDNADRAVIAPFVRADHTWIDVGGVLAGGAEADALFNLEDRIREGLRFVLAGAQKVVGKPLGTFGTDAGETVQLLD